jgi:hypothetical protein
MVEKRFCEKCQEILNEDAFYCSYCGQKNEPVETDPKLNNSFDEFRDDPNKQKDPWYLAWQTSLLCWFFFLFTSFAILIGHNQPQGGVNLSFWMGCIFAIRFKKNVKSECWVLFLVL